MPHRLLGLRHRRYQRDQCGGSTPPEHAEPYTRPRREGLHLRRGLGCHGLLDHGKVLIHAGLLGRQLLVPLAHFLLQPLHLQAKNHVQPRQSRRSSRSRTSAVRAKQQSPTATLPHPHIIAQSLLFSNGRESTIRLSWRWLDRHKPGPRDSLSEETAERSTAMHTTHARRWWQRPPSPSP